MGAFRGAGDDGAGALGAPSQFRSADWPEVVYNFDPDPDRHISSDCVPVIRAIREFRTCPKVEVKKLHGSFSGALVLLAKPFGADRCELPSSVLKYDKKANVLWPNYCMFSVFSKACIVWRFLCFLRYWTRPRRRRSTARRSGRRTRGYATSRSTESGR